MTFGIDISGFQAGIDLVKAKAEGTEFVIVKASGFNVSPMYVADEYHDHVDNAIAAGLEVGHYFLIGGGQVWRTPTEQARFFVQNLYRFDVKRHVLMIDNEGLNSNGYLFDDDESAEFMAEVIRLTGIVPKHVWHYAGARDYRNLKPWPKIEALGIRYVWAAYGDYPTGKTPDHEPSLQGSIPRWDVHQFTSKSAVAGKSVDGNFSPHPISELFGGDAPMSALQECYATLVTPYGVPGPFYDALGHRGADYRRGALQAIVAYDDMSVEYVGFNSALGTVVGLRRLTLGGFAGFAHTVNPPPVGRFIPKGSTIAQVAGSGNSPGSSWTGPHIHTTQSAVSAYNAAVGVRPLSDPAPTIARAVGSSTAGGGYTPVEDELSAAAESQINEIYNAIFKGGPGMEDSGNPIQRSLAQIQARLNQKIERPKDFIGNDGPVSQIQELADINTIVRILLERDGSGVDLDALAEKIVARIPAGGGAPVDPAAVAKAVRAEFKANPLS